MRSTSRFPDVESRSQRQLLFRDRNDSHFEKRRRAKRLETLEPLHDSRHDGVMLGGAIEGTQVEVGGNQPMGEIAQPLRVDGDGRASLKCKRLFVYLPISMIVGVGSSTIVTAIRGD
jgi:hypothetical protein